MSWARNNGYEIPGSIHTPSLQIGSGGSVSSYSLDSLGDQVSTKTRDRKKSLARESSHLIHKLALRPYDVRALNQLAIVDYRRGDYESTIKIIAKLIKLNEYTTELLLIMGKCYFQRWIRDKNENDLLLALGAYKSAIDNPDMAQHPSPTPWFEMVSILVRLGRYQAALDTLGIVMTIYTNKSKQYQNWIILVQYNVAQILLLAGRLTEAVSIYRDLLLYKVDITVPIEQDAIVLLPMRMLHGVLIIEMGRLTQLQGKSALALAVYKENWLSIYHAMKFGHSDVNAWLGDIDSLKGLASFFCQEQNFFMAGEYYGMAAELISQDREWNDIPYEESQQIIELVLRRGELLAEVSAFKQAEFCAHFAVSRANGDLIVLARAGACCRKDNENNSEIVNSAAEIVRAVSKIQWALRSAFWRIKNKLKKRRILKATKIVSFIRMCLVRNRLIGPRLSVTSPKRIVSIANHFKKVAMKSGKKVLQDYFVIWDASAGLIQRMVSKWMHRRSWDKFWNGMQILRRLIKGQHCRLLLRKRLQHYFEKLQSGLNNDEHGDEDQASTYNRSEVCVKSDYDRCHINKLFPIFRNWDAHSTDSNSTVERVSSGFVVYTSMDVENVPAVSQETLAFRTARKHHPKKSNRPTSKAKQASTSEKTQAVTAASPLEDMDNIPPHSMQSLHRTVRSIPPKRINRSASAMNTAAASLLSVDQYAIKSNLHSDASLDEMPVSKIVSSGDSIYTINVMDKKKKKDAESIIADCETATSPTIRSPQHTITGTHRRSSVGGSPNEGVVGAGWGSSSVVSTESSAVASSVAPNPRELTSRAQDGFSWFQRPGGSGSGGNTTMSLAPYKSPRINKDDKKEMKQLLSKELNTTFSLTQVALPTLKLDRAGISRPVSGDDNTVSTAVADIITQVSINNMLSLYNHTVRWVPFCILPESEICKLLSCTVLSITSPSFCTTDSKR
jgi:tetratricopeptide (TPR) repeat protein